MKNKKILVSLIIVIQLITVIFITGCKKKDKDIGNVDSSWALEEKPGDDVLATRVETINTTIANGEDVVAAAIHLFEVAEKNMVAAPYYATFSNGSGTGTTGPFGGDMTVRSFNINNNGNSYYRSTGYITKGIPDIALIPAKALLEFTERTYYDKATNINYKQKTKGTNANANFDEDGYPTGDFFTDKKTISKKWSCNDEAALALYKKQERIRNFRGEKMNHVLAAAAIENVTVVHNDAGYYTVNFSYKTDEETANNYTNFGRDGLREAATSEDLKYVILNYHMDVWDSGYFRNFGSTESWDATITIKVLGSIHGASNSTNLQTFTWKKDDCSLDDYDDWISDTQYTFAEATEEN